MIYNYKEYRHVFDTPAKKLQEKAVVEKIMKLLNENVYDDIDKFIDKNKTYQDFLKNNKFENVVKHFGNTLNEDDYLRIVDSIKKIIKDKQSFDKTNIETTNIGDNQYNYFNDGEKEYLFDNSNSGISIERQMEILQPTQSDFQTADKKQNTENMMKELDENKKNSFNLHYLKDFNIELLNEKQQEILRVATNFQFDIINPIRIDIDKGIIVDNNNNIFKIEEVDGQLQILGDNDKLKNNEEMQSANQTITLQKTITPRTSTIYSTNN